MTGRFGLASQNLAITGSDGFLGWHLRSHLKALAPNAIVRPIDRATFHDEKLLKEQLVGVDVLIHLAGANRGPDNEVAEVNVRLAQQLTAALHAVSSRPRLVYANSVQAEGSSPYGFSKAEAAQIFQAWSQDVGAPFTDLLFPNLFGECGRPHYNSAIATFCDDLISNRDSLVNENGRTELLHAQDACSMIVEAATGHEGGRKRIEGQVVTVPEVYSRLTRLLTGYSAATLPYLNDRLDLQLFNSLRAALYPDGSLVRLDCHRDSRGTFVELARGHGQTQTSFSTTVPGITRGDHFHFDKIERFIVLKGRAVIRLRRLFDAAITSFEVSGTTPAAVDMPTLHTHSITNVGDDELITVFWANDHFQPAAPDTYAEPVGPLIERVHI